MKWIEDRDHVKDVLKVPERGRHYRDSNDKRPQRSHHDHPEREGDERSTRSSTRRDDSERRDYYRMTEPENILVEKTLS